MSGSPSGKKMDIQTEERMTSVNPLSEIPAGVMGAREGCILAFSNARKAFGDQIGADFERALENLEHADFEVSTDGNGHMIGTRFSSGAYLSLSVDETTITLSFFKDGKEDSIRYEDGEIKRRRMV